MRTSTATIKMTMREADRLKTVQAVVDRMLRVGHAAQRLGMSMTDRATGQAPICNETSGAQLAYGKLTQKGRDDWRLRNGSVTGTMVMHCRETSYPA